MVALLVGTQVTTDNGLVTPYGIILPPGSQIAAYVRSTGAQSQDTAFIATNLVPTLAAGLARARPGLGDFVVVLPGHVENVADATTFSGSLQAGVKIVGVGRGGNTPTFTFTTTGSQWLVNKADVSITGLRFVLDAVNNVVAAINVTAADFGFYGNELTCASVSGGPIIVLTMAAGAARFDITGNVFRGNNSGAAATAVAVTGAVDAGRIADNEMTSCWVSATGAINITAAATNLKILRNIIENTAAASVAAINFANVAVDGMCCDNRFFVKNTGAMVSGTNVIVLGAGCLVGFDQNFCSNDVLKSGILLPTADT